MSPAELQEKGMRGRTAVVQSIGLARLVRGMEMGGDDWA